MRHIFLLDPLEQLKPYKDSSLMMALTCKELGIETYLLFIDDYHIHSQESPSLKVHHFSGKIRKDFFMEAIELEASKSIKLEKNDVFHFRPDPPVDAKYLNLAWMTQYLKEKIGFRVVNDPMGAISYNEKLLSFKEENSLESVVSNQFEVFKNFSETLIQKNIEEFIVKPLNLFSGIGVEKYHVKELEKLELRLSKSNDLLLMQPFDERINAGEVRSIFWESSHLGSVLKIPKAGSILSNTSQGSSIREVSIDEKLLDQCEKICNELLDFGVKLVAFDILAGNISEVNITCPSLLVELSHIYKENKCLEIIKSLS